MERAGTMATQTLTPGIWSGFWSLLSVRLSALGAPSISAQRDEDTRAEHDFSNEIVCGNPDAFSSELDVQCMMHMLPGKW